MEESDAEQFRREKLFSFFDKIESTKGTLIIGGDFFDFWFDYKGYVPFEYLDIFERLKNLKNNGIDIYYVLGNHDYWDFGYLSRTTNIIFHKTDSSFVDTADNSGIIGIDEYAS